MSVIVVPDKRLETFYQHNPAFDILQTNLTSQAELDKLNWLGVEQAPTLDVLKQYQRLLRLNPDPAIARALLGPTAGPQALQASHPGPLHSAQAIAALPREQFVQKYSELVGGPAIAGQIHQNATTVAAQTQHLWANVQNLVASPHFRAMRVNNLDQSVYQFADLPGYQELFGSLDYCQCDECQSIFGPAAYFVDLMRIIDRSITTPNAQTIGDSSLDTRRPDLAQIELTCANTNGLLPYLDIVNTILETQAAGLPSGTSPAQISDAAYNALATAIYPFNLPFHLPLEQIRSYLGQLKTDLATLYQTFKQADNAIDRETLKFSPAAYTLITTPKTDTPSLTTAYGMSDASQLLDQLAQPKIFLQQTGLSMPELSDLLTQNLSSQEFQANIAHEFYINQVLDQKLFLSLANNTIQNLSLAALDRLHRFIRLAHRLNWTFADLDWVLHSLAHSEIDAQALQDIAKIRRLQTKVSLPLDVLCSFWFDIKTIGTGTSGPSQALFDRVFNNRRMLGTQTPYHPQYQNNPLYTDTPLTLPAANARLAASLGLSLDDFTALSATFLKDGDQFTVQNLSVLYRHTQLAAFFKLPMKQYLLFLQLTGKQQQTFTPDELSSLLEIANWLRVAGFNVYELDYILHGTPSMYVAPRYRDEDVPSFLQLLGASPLNQQKDKLIQALATFLGNPTDNVEALLETITGTLSLPPGIQSYFAVFYLQPGQTTYTDAQKAYIQQALAALSRALTLVDKMQLTSAEITSIGTTPACYNISDKIQNFTIDDLRHISTFKQLTAAFQDTQNLLVGYFATLPPPSATIVPSPDTLAASLATITGWDKAQIEALVALPSFKSGSGLLTTVEGIASLKKVFDLNAALGADMAFQQQILSLATSPSDMSVYIPAANAVIGLVKAKYSDDTWTQVSEKLTGALDEAKRNALTGYVLSKRGLKNLRALSEHLLIDVEMTGCASISKIKQGILSLQMYLQRCRMNLESGVHTMSGIDETWWEWMMSYRIWQANRKVFLYPENYLDPTLRKNQSDLFQELSSELLQSDITPDTVETAYQHYFDGLADLAKLRISESYRCSVQQPDGTDPIDTLFFFGRTATEPTTFYYRTCVNPASTTGQTWTPWSKMDVRIQSDYISPVFAFGKLFVFWVEIQSQTTQDSAGSSKVTTHKATIKYTFQTLSSQWVQPQTLEKDIVIGIDPENYKPAGVDLNLDDLVWKKIYALDVPALSSATENLLLLYGSMFLSPPTLPAQPTGTPTAFDSQVYTALSQSYKAAQGGIQGYSSVLPAATLNGNLLIESTPTILPQLRHTTARLSQARSSLAATTVGSLALFAGGALALDPTHNWAAGVSNVVDIYDARTGTWSVEHLSQARAGIAATSVGSLAFFAGGTLGDDDTLLSNVVDIYNASATPQNKWSTATLPNTRTGIAATSVGPLALFAGGQANVLWSDNSLHLNFFGDLDIYDTETNTWTSLTLSKPRSGISAITVGSLAIFVGGFDASGASSAVDIYNYDAEKKQLVPLSPSSIPNVSSQAAAIVGEQALFAGGFTGAWNLSQGYYPESATATVNIYQPSTQTWVQNPPQLSVARTGLAATSTGTLALFAGGQEGTNLQPATQTVSAVCDVYDLLLQKWSTLTLSQARYGLAATSVGSRAIFAGGMNAAKTMMDSVDIFDTGNVIYNNYLSDVVSTDEEQQGAVSSLASQLGLSNVKQNAAIFTVKNQPDWFTFDNGDEAFLAATAHPRPLISENLQLTDQQGFLVVAYNGTSPSNPGQVVFTRLTTSVVEQLSQRAFVGGIDHLLTPASQSLPELDFARFRPGKSVSLPASTQLDFHGAYGTYFQEIFFFIPFLIASTLNANQQFADAQKWYQYIFNPTQPSHLAGYWPLNEESGETLNDLAGNSNGSFALAKWQTVSDFPGLPSRSVLEFNQSTGGGWVSFPPEGLLSGSEMTMSFWAFQENSSPARAAVPPVPSGTGTRSTIFDIRPPMPDGTVLFSCGGDGENVDEITYKVDAQLYQGRWSYWTFTKNAVLGEMCIYLNGTLLYSEKNKTRMISSTSANDLASIVIVDGKLAEVRMWRTALNPDKIVPCMNEQLTDRFWRYLPFRDGMLETLKQILTDSQAIKAYNDDPFDPYAIAQVRFGTYQKAIVMKYIDNLLDWGDSLFTQDTWESITQATMLYLLAYDLLGPRPENLGPCPAPSPETFADIKKQYGEGNIPQFFLELEQRTSIPGGTSAIVSSPFNDLNAYFGVSENDQFVAYWDRVEDRLYKIRHCQNISGVFQQLALFEPPLNPMDLVRAVAAGNTPLGVTSGPSADVSVPHYRFNELLERAKSITSTLVQLGEGLLSALEKKDAEQLSLLKARQEAAILQLIRTTKEKQISAAQASQDALNQSLAAAQNRVTHYQGLLNGGLSANEQNGLMMMNLALPFQETATGLNAAATVLFLLPTIFGLADGGMDFGQSIATAASVTDGIAAIMNQQGSLAAAIAQYARRAEDWQLELQMAQDDVILITRQIAAAQIAVDIATSELASHQKSIDQANEIEDFLQSKFSSQALYQWMVNRLSGFYFQTFKMAQEMALAVQKSYQYELNNAETYIAFNYWDNLKQGLLAGDGLLFSLNQLEKAYLDKHSRTLEIEKTISLLQLDPDAFLTLKSTGKCQFRLREQLFDYDFPGHYCRQIKTISLSIPAIVGPYQNINATLTQLSDQVLLQPDPNGVRYLLGAKDAAGNDATMPDSSVLRTGWRSNQKIALSRGMNDSGMFELNFRDERYLPFEGTGAVSSWELSMPKATNRFDFSRLSDVIIHLSYTALDAGPGDFTSAVQSALKSYTGAYYINIKQTFPGAWHSLLSVQTDPKAQSLVFPLSSEIIPPHLTKTSVKLTELHCKMDVTDNLDLSVFGSFLSLTIGSASPALPPVALDKDNTAEVPIPASGILLENFAKTWVISVDLTKLARQSASTILKNGFLDPAKVRNMEYILFYEGDIAWNE